MNRLVAIETDASGVRRHLAKRVDADSDKGCHVLNPHFRAKEPLTPAAVLVPLVERDEGTTVILTKRTDKLKDHPGQISFPGGRVDPGDEGPISTALRETEEEIGIAPERIEVLGRLDTYLTATGFSVTPVVGRVQTPFQMVPDPFEVAEVFEVPLRFLLDPANHLREERWFGDLQWFAYAMPYANYRIWGVTAGMIRNFYEILLSPYGSATGDEKS
ncbi:MAG: CoA pyrophosphatase [Rhodospirillales bacterium]